MDQIVALLVLLHVSQHALGVEVYAGMESVVLPCRVDMVESVKSTVTWTREELKNTEVHTRQQSGDAHEKQNDRYVNRTSMRTDALQTGDLSLTLRKPTISDSGAYNCTVRRFGQTLSRTEVQLLVTEPPPLWVWILIGVLIPLLVLGVFFSAIAFQAHKAMKDRLNEQLKVAEVVEGAEEVDLFCTSKAAQTESIRVEWRRSVPKYIVIHNYVDGEDIAEVGYVGRTKMKEDPRVKGVFTLNLKKPQLEDGGVYICTIYSEEQILRQKIVVLSVRETWINTIKGLFPCCSKKSSNTADQHQSKREGNGDQAPTATPLMAEVKV